MRKVFGIGETILDIIFRNDQPQKAVPGGSVFNGLISLGRLNVPVSFISELGNDRVGDMIRDFMEDNHITTEFVDRFPDGKSPISLAFLDDDKNANYIFYKDYPAQRLEVPLPKIVRGSDEDFQNLYGKSDAQEVYKEHIQFYCDRFLTTHGANGVNLHTRNFTRHFDSPQIQPLSTIGAGDNFNAGIIYGLLKYDVRHADLPSLDQDTWRKIIRCGMDLASEVCQSYDNYISKEFAAKYVSQS